MQPARANLIEIVRIAKRRKFLLIFPILLVTAISTIGAFLLERKYESTTTILVRVDKTLNELRGYELVLAQQEQMGNVEEIVYSRSFIRALIDTLRLAYGGETSLEDLISVISKNIKTSKSGSSIFTLSYIDSDPVRAQKAAQTLADLFIQTKLRFEIQQNTATVQYLEKKVDEYKREFETSVQSLVSSIRQNLNEVPSETRSLYSQVDETEKALAGSQSRTKKYQNSLQILRNFPDSHESGIDILQSEGGRNLLLELQLEDIPLVVDLRTLVSEFTQLTRRYTGNHPEVREIGGRIVDHLARMKKAAETELDKEMSLAGDLERRRTKIIEELQQSSSVSRMTGDKQANYEMNRKLYDEMQLKLEQARIAYEVANRGANQFIILDPANLPSRPTKPNRTIIMIGGIGLGIFIGLLSAAAAEFMDTTLRNPREVAVFRKPVIGLLPQIRRN